MKFEPFKEPNSDDEDENNPKPHDGNLSHPNGGHQ